MSLTKLFNTTAERFVLGAILVDAETMYRARSLITAADFAGSIHRVIWAAACAVFDAGNEVDRLTVINELQRRNELEMVGGFAGIVSLDDGMPTLTRDTFDSYCRVLHEKTAMRRLTALGENLQSRAELGEEKSEELLESLANSYLDIAKSMGERRVPISAREVIELQGLEKILAPPQTHGLRLPWSRLDHALCGLHPEQFVCIAGHTSRGKTSFALQIATAAARHTGVLIVSLEMGAASLIRRMAVQISGVHAGIARIGGLNATDREAYARAAYEVASAPIFFDSSSDTAAAIHAAVKGLKTYHNIGLVVVDYLGLLRAPGKVESRTREVAYNSRALKSAAMKLGLPFLVLSQVSRDPAKQGRRLTLHDLKETGDIENDADVILLLHAEKSEDALKPITLEVAKQREGPRDIDIPMRFDTQTQRFYEVDEHRE